MFVAFLLLIFAAIYSASSPHSDATSDGHVMVRREEMDIYSLNLAEKYGLTPSTELSYDILEKIMKGVENNNKDNVYFYALMKLYGVSATRNVTSAAEYLKRAADLGNPDALTAYGMMLLSGNGVSQDFPQAATYFRRAVRLGDSNAHWLLGKMILEGKGVSAPNYAEAIGLLLIASDRSVPQAHHELGLVYEYGLGAPQDFEKAVAFYIKGTEQNDVESAYHLALMYTYGRPGSTAARQDYKKALALFESASIRNHAPSTYYMGLFKLYGYGCQPNYPIAINWFERAAGMDDERISGLARSAADELRGMYHAALEKNEQIVDKYRRMGER